MKRAAAQGEPTDTCKNVLYMLRMPVALFSIASCVLGVFSLVCGCCRERVRWWVYQRWRNGQGSDPKQVSITQQYSYGIQKVKTLPYVLLFSLDPFLLCAGAFVGLSMAQSPGNTLRSRPKPLTRRSLCISWQEIVSPRPLESTKFIFDYFLSTMPTSMVALRRSSCPPSKLAACQTMTLSRAIRMTAFVTLGRTQRYKIP
jgi:hypothetical protein